MKASVQFCVCLDIVILFMWKVIFVPVQLIFVRLSHVVLRRTFNPPVHKTPSMCFG